MSNEDLYGLPIELCCRPQPVIGLAGLDVSKNNVHRFIWDAFNKNQSRLPLQMKLIPSNHQFPPLKPKKLNADRTKGIIKKNWLKKHLLEVPAVVAILFELCWDDPNWEQQKNLCVQLVMTVKGQIGGLGTKIAVILIQKEAPLPAAEDAANFCRECDIPNKQLFVLSQDDHLQGYIMRLEKELHELAKVYYTQEIKQLKVQIEQMNKTTHRYLFVRHHFKMGFFCEMKQDDRAGKSSYNTAFTQLKEVRLNDNCLMEIKTVAGFINYKICSLMFRLGEPRDALTQLRSHVRLYKNHVGTKELSFEHYAWLAVQYAAFADLFDEAIRQGLSAVQTEHPGFYYRQAALYASDRKSVARDLPANVSTPTDLAVTTTEYWGQRPWRLNKLSMEPPDPLTEKLGIQSLQSAEKKVDHSAAIVGYLGSAISHFKTYRCPRMRLQLLVKMAEEYHSARDHGKALTLLSHMLGDYRNEKWFTLLGTLLKLGLSSAYLSANIQDFITFAMEALGPAVPLDPAQKENIFNNFMAILRKETPKPDSEENALDITKAESLWSAVPSEPIVIDLKSISTCLAVRARFSKETFLINEQVTADLQIKSFCPGSIKLGRISVSVLFDTSSVDLVSSEDNINIQEVGTVELKCEGSSRIEAGKELRFGTVSIPFIIPNGRSFTLKLLPQPCKNIVLPEFENLRISRSNEKWEGFTGPETAVVESLKAAVTLDIKHDGQALLGEQYPVHITVVNDEPTAMFHPVLEVKLVSPGDENSPDQSTRLSDAQQTSISPRSIKVLLETVPAEGLGTTCIYVKGYSIGDRTLAFILTYSQSDDVTVPGKGTAVEELITIPISKPFEISSECLTTKFQHVNLCYMQETFLLYTSVFISAPCPLTIHHSTLELALYTAIDGKELTSQLAGTTLGPGEVGSDIFPIKLTEAKDQAVAVGTYVLQWSRKDSNAITSSSITLPAIRCLPTIMSVDMVLPAHGRMRTPMTVEYRLFNRTSNLLQLDMHIDPCDAFMLAGQRQALLRLLPETEHCLQYKLYPLLSGLVALPQIVLSAPEITEELKGVLERSLPSHIYVMPQEKVPTTVGL